MTHSPFAHGTHERPCPVCGSSELRGRSLTRVDGARFGECLQCGLLYASPAPSSQALSTFYASYYTEYRDLVRPSKKAIAQTVSDGALDVLTSFALQSCGGVPRSVVDVGCGQGARLALFAELGAATLTGCELDRVGIDFAKAEYGLSITHGDATALLSTGARYHLVLCSEVLEHVLEPVLLLEQLRDLLEPDGVLAISTPNAGSRHRAGAEWNALGADFDHVAYFDTVAMSAALAKAGLRPLELLPLGVPSPSAERARAREGRALRAARRVGALASRLRGAARTSPWLLEPSWGHTLLVSARHA